MRRVRIAAAALLAAVLAIAGVLIPSAASADNGTSADISAEIVKSVTIKTVWRDDIRVYDALSVEVELSTKGNRSPSVNEGDTFSIEFPSQLNLPNGSLELNGTDADGNPAVLATCEADSDTETLTCTLNATAAAKTYVEGSISARVQAWEEVTAEELTFNIGSSATIGARLPGGKIGPYQAGTYPTTLDKWAWQDSHEPGVILWTLVIPASIVEQGETITISDEQLGDQAFSDPARFWLRSYSGPGDWEASYDEARVPTGTNSLEYVDGSPADVTLNVTSDKTFEMSFPNLLSSDGLYMIKYTTEVPVNTVTGQSFTNTAEINGQEIDNTFGYINRLSGDLNGPGTGGLTVTKVVSGDGADLANGQEFKVQAEWTVDGQDFQEILTPIAGGAADSLLQLPIGTVVTLTEVSNISIPGMDSYTPVFSSTSDGVVISDDALSAEVTIVEGTTAAVLLNNTITRTSTPSVSVGDYVWHDVNRDGLQDDSDKPLENVTLTLTGPNGEDVRDINGELVPPTSTNDKGQYEFFNLPVLQPGESYRVTVTPPQGYEPTNPGTGDDRAKDSSTGFAESGNLTNDGDSDPTLDFGFITPPEPPRGETSPPPNGQTPPPNGQTPPPPGTQTPPLADTGADISGWVALAVLALLATGGALVLIRRRSA
ncbi:MAG: SdrD B-like domain-containing protein [Beutenbergiaceae bacterium]